MCRLTRDVYDLSLIGAPHQCTMYVECLCTHAAHPSRCDQTGHPMPTSTSKQVLPARSVITRCIIFHTLFAVNCPMASFCQSNKIVTPIFHNEVLVTEICSCMHIYPVHCGVLWHCSLLDLWNGCIRRQIGNTLATRACQFDNSVVAGGTVLWQIMPPLMAMLPHWQPFVLSEGCFLIKWSFFRYACGLLGVIEVMCAFMYVCYK